MIEDRDRHDIDCNKGQGNDRSCCEIEEFSYTLLKNLLLRLIQL